MATARNPVVPHFLRRRVVGVVVFAIATILLMSMGGAIFAAPITIPLMVLTARHHPTVAFRAAGTVLVGLTVAEVVWALAYLRLGEVQPWIWLLPLLAGVRAAGGVVAWTSARGGGIAA